MSDENPAIAADSPTGYNRGNRNRRGSVDQGGNRLGSSFLVLLVLGLLLSGYFIFQQNRELANNQKILLDSEQRIQQLEQRLRVTDETMSESGACLLYTSPSPRD